MTAKTGREMTVPAEKVTSEIALPEAPAAFVEANQKFRKALEKYDPAFRKVWDELSGFVDTNAMILFNLKQIQLMLQGAQIDMYERQQKLDMILAAVAEHGEGANDVYQKQQQTAQTELHQARNYILRLSASVTTMAREYRQCAMQKKFVVHLVQVQQLLMLIKASIQRHVRDKDVQDQISLEIQEASTRLFANASSEEDD